MKRSIASKSAKPNPRRKPGHLQEQKEMALKKKVAQRAAKIDPKVKLHFLAVAEWKLRRDRSELYQKRKEEFWRAVEGK